MPPTPASPWMRRLLAGYAELDALQTRLPMIDAVVDEIDGRRMRVGGQWLEDFASCNYLGFDLDTEIIEGVPDYLRTWGTHPSWSRMIASPVLFEQIEERVRDLTGAPDVLALPTLTHLHTAVLPLLGGGGTLLVDSRAHRTIQDGAFLAKARGATVRRFRHGDLDHLAHMLGRYGTANTLICMDGINSMTGNPPDLRAVAALAREHDATVYVDDAHGFGVIGELDDHPEGTPFGRRGNAIVRHAGETYDNIILTAGFSKAYSSLMAFIACPSDLKRLLKLAAAPYTFSGPPPVASLATALLGLEANERHGDERRARLWRLTDRLLQHLAKLDAAILNTSGFPIVEIPLADATHAEAVGNLLFDQGIYVTMAIYPAVPREETGFRVQVTAANTDEQITHLLAVIDEVDERFGLRRRVLA